MGILCSNKYHNSAILSRHILPQALEQYMTVRDLTRSKVAFQLRDFWRGAVEDIMEAILFPVKMWVKIMARDKN